MRQQKAREREAADAKEREREIKREIERSEREREIRREMERKVRDIEMKWERERESVKKEEELAEEAAREVVFEY